MDNSPDYTFEQRDNDVKETKQVTHQVKIMIDKICCERKNNFVSMIHNSEPNLNRTRYKIPPKIVQKTDWKLSLPAPAFISSYGLLDIDPCHRRTFEHKRYLNSLRWLPESYRKRKANKLYRKSEKRDVYNYNIIKLAESLELKPDAYFSGRYDWYFTGGNLDVIESNNDQYVVHAAGKKLQNIYVSKADIDTTCIKLMNVFRKRSQVITRGNYDPEVLEIQCLNNSIVSTRRRNYVSLYNFEDNGLLKYRYHLQNRLIPFISSTKESNTSGNIVTSDLTKTVAIWDLNKSAEKPAQLLFSATNPEKDKNWNCVRYLDERTFALVDTRNMYVLDRRVSYENNAREYPLHARKEDCDENTIVSPSYFDQLIYIGSTHKLQAVDRRYMGVNAKGREYVVLEWTHQMNGFPLMLRRSLVDNVEMIVICSYENGDMRICQNNKVKLKGSNGKDKRAQYVYSSTDLPLQPPSVQEAFRKARLEGLCISPYFPMAEHLKYSHSGLCLLETNEPLSILTAKSNGDIFGQSIVDDEEENIINENILADMKQWQDRLFEIDERNQKILNVTNVENFDTLRKIMRCEELNEDENVSNDDDETIPNAPRLGKWQQTLQSLEKYKDVLAANILSIWDFDETEINNRSDRLVLPSQEPVFDGTNVIDQWLERSKVGVVDESVLNMSGISLDNLFDNTGNNEIAVPKSAKKEKKSLKRKYIKGF